MTFFQFIGQHPILTVILFFIGAAMFHDLIVDAIRAGASCPR